MSKIVKKHSTREPTYTEEDVGKALEAIKSGMSIRNASKIYQIPRTTLLYKHTGKSPISAKKGPALVLTDKEESDLVSWFTIISDKGFTLSKQQILDSVQILVNKIVKRKTPFSDGRPGRHWYEKFIRRHSKLTQTIDENTRERRATLNEEKLKNWFQETNRLLGEKQLLDIHPSRVFTYDEAAFFLNPEADKILIQRGSKAISNLGKSNDRECLTTMFTVNASGTIAPPMVMFRYQRTPQSIRSSIPDNWVHGNSSNGWMTGETFYDYIADTFYPWLLENQIELPIILYIDKTSTNLTMSLCEFCEKNKIELLPLQANATHIIQPLTVAFFQPMKFAWKDIVKQWNEENFGRKFRKEDFSSALKQTMDFVYDNDFLRAGFMSCGLCPFSLETIDYTTIKNFDSYKENRIVINSKSINDDDDVDGGGDCENESVKFLQLLEKYLPDDKLTSFKENEDNPLWIGDEKDTNLFYFWLNIRTLADSE